MTEYSYLPTVSSTFEEAFQLLISSTTEMRGEEAEEMNVPYLMPSAAITF